MLKPLMQPLPNKDHKVLAPEGVPLCPLHGQMVESADQRYWVCLEGPECPYFNAKEKNSRHDLNEKNLGLSIGRSISQSKRRQTSGRFKVKQAGGFVTDCSSRVAKSGNQAHSFRIQNTKFSIFSNDELSPVTTGDRVSFDYEIRHLKSGSRREYFSVLPESLIIVAPVELDSEVEGEVYILSNASMPGLFKVGFTTGSVAKRASELSGVTSVPTAFHIEWSLPIVGDPRAVEQRAHAHLSAKRHGKEFFKVSLVQAKNACIQSFSELYPDRAKTMDEAFAKRAETEIQRREKLAELEREKQQAREEEAAKKAFDATHEGQWLKYGSCQVILEEFRYEPTRGNPSFWYKLFGTKYDDFLEFNIRVLEYKECISWELRIMGRIQEETVYTIEKLSTQNDAMARLSTAVREFPAALNRHVTVDIPNKLIENPPELPSKYGNPRVILKLKTLGGLKIKTKPVQ